MAPFSRLVSGAQTIVLTYSSGYGPVVLEVQRKLIILSLQQEPYLGRTRNLLVKPKCLRAFKLRLVNSTERLVNLIQRPVNLTEKLVNSIKRLVNSIKRPVSSI